MKYNFADEISLLSIGLYFKNLVNVVSCKSRYIVGFALVKMTNPKPAIYRNENTHDPGAAMPRVKFDNNTIFR